MLQAARLRAGKTLKQAARHLDPHATEMRVWYWEHFRCLPHVEDVKRLAEFYGIDPEEFADQFAVEVGCVAKIGWRAGRGWLRAQGRGKRGPAVRRGSRDQPAVRG